MTNETETPITKRETAAVVFHPVEGAEGISAIDATVVRFNRGGTKFYQVYTPEEVGKEGKSLSGAFSHYCEAVDTISKNYIVPGTKDMDWVDPNAASDDWHDYEGAEELGKQIAGLVDNRNQHAEGVRVANIEIARVFVQAETLLESGDARSAWLDEFFPEGRNNSDASELRKLGNWPQTLLDVCPRSNRSPKGFDKWLLGQRDFLASAIAEKAAPDGKESVTVKTLDKAFAAVSKSLEKDFSDGDKASKTGKGEEVPAGIAKRNAAKAALVVFNMHAENIKSAGASGEIIEQNEETGKWTLTRVKSMKTPICRAVIANYQATAGDELLTAIVSKINNMLTKEEADEAGRHEAERTRTEPTSKVIKEAVFAELDAGQAALHLFNVACTHAELSDIAKHFARFVEQVEQGVPASAILEGLTEKQAEDADAVEADEAEDAA